MSSGKCFFHRFPIGRDLWKKRIWRTALIREFEEQFGYDMKVDNPDKLLPHISKDLLIIHDKQDRTVPYEDSLKASKQFPKITLHTTLGLGHKKVLFDETTVKFVTDHLCKKIGSAPALKYPQ
jgi:pimeloyl-ACP methyl ester carboxylesterase